MKKILIYLVPLFLALPGLQAGDSLSVAIIPRLELPEESRGMHSGICGGALEQPLVILVKDLEGNPLECLPVAFRIIATPDQAGGFSLSKSMVLSDSLGKASTRLTLGSKPGIYRISCRTEAGFPDNEVIFSARASKKNWVWMLIIGLFGGLGLFLFGMHTMSEGMQQSAGQRMRSILALVTRNRLVGVGIGTVVTTIIQSSSATSVMLVSFVNAKLIRFRQTIPVLLGAAIGTTITAQIIAFKITEYSLLLVAVG